MYRLSGAAPPCAAAVARTFGPLPPVPSVSSLPVLHPTSASRRTFSSHAEPLVRPSLVLGIESSCDETGAAVVATDGRVLGQSLTSQWHLHAPLGGVVPQIAVREHAAHIHAVIADALTRAGTPPPANSGAAAGTPASTDAAASTRTATPSRGDINSSAPVWSRFVSVLPVSPCRTALLSMTSVVSAVAAAPADASASAVASEVARVRPPVDAVAVAAGPGLSSCLGVGIVTATELARAWGVPLLAVNHVEAHSLVAQLNPGLAAPAAAEAVGAVLAGSGADTAPPSVVKAVADTAATVAGGADPYVEGLYASARYIARSLQTRTAAFIHDTSGVASSLPVLAPLATPPYLSLIASGGHSQLVWTAAPGQHTVLAATLDDAAGEALDKAHRVAGLARLDLSALETVVAQEERTRTREAVAAVSTPAGSGAAAAFSAEVSFAAFLPSTVAADPAPASVYSAFSAATAGADTTVLPASLLWPHLTDTRVPSTLPMTPLTSTSPPSPFTVYPRDLGAVEATRESRHRERRRRAHTASAASPWAAEPSAAPSSARAWLEWRNLCLLGALHGVPLLPTPASEAGTRPDFSASAPAHTQQTPPPPPGTVPAPGAVLERAATLYARLSCLLAGCVTLPPRPVNANAAAASELKSFSADTCGGVLTWVSSLAAAAAPSPEAPPLPVLMDTGADADGGVSASAPAPAPAGEVAGPAFAAFGLPGSALPLPPRARVPASPLMPPVDIPLALQGRGDSSRVAHSYTALSFSGSKTAARRAVADEAAAVDAGVSAALARRSQDAGQQQLQQQQQQQLEEQRKQQQKQEPQKASRREQRPQAAAQPLAQAHVDALASQHAWRRLVHSMQVHRLVGQLRSADAETAGTDAAVADAESISATRSAAVGVWGPTGSAASEATTAERLSPLFQLAFAHAVQSATARHFVHRLACAVQVLEGAIPMQSAPGGAEGDVAPPALGMSPPPLSDRSAPRRLVLCGGVAANGALRELASRAAAHWGFTTVAAPRNLCTDNGVMIAWAAAAHARAAAAVAGGSALADSGGTATVAVAEAVAGAAGEPLGALGPQLRALSVLPTATTTASVPGPGAASASRPVLDPRPRWPMGPLLTVPAPTSRKQGLRDASVAAETAAAASRRAGPVASVSARRVASTSSFRTNAHRTYSASALRLPLPLPLRGSAPLLSPARMRLALADAEIVAAAAAEAAAAGASDDDTYAPWWGGDRVRSMTALRRGLIRAGPLLLAHEFHLLATGATGPALLPAHAAAAAAAPGAFRRLAFARAFDPAGRSVPCDAVCGLLSPGVVRRLNFAVAGSRNALLARATATARRAARGDAAAAAALAVGATADVSGRGKAPAGDQRWRKAVKARRRGSAAKKRG